MPKRPTTDEQTADAKPKARQRGIQSVEIGFSILDTMVRAGGPLPLSRVAEETGLTVANAHYYLVSFQRVGVVQQDADTGHYGLGSYALKLGVAALEQFDVYKLARPAMIDISDQSGHTVFLGVWGNKGPTIVNRIEGRRGQPLLELRVGSVLPLLSSALGRNFAAHLPETVTASLLQEELSLQSLVAEPQDAGVPRNVEAFREMAARIREQGYSRCRNSLLPNFTSLSAPIFDLSGTIIAALTVMGPNHLLHEASEAQTLALLKAHAAEISQTAGVYG
ncbi:IclR family transcriptional regulator [Bordetella hinzii]|uniref:IclR family transcriptional regulator n=1 Tax=Bordetella hinzii TaxID=103855 RepID=UPI001C011B84|nr:IclR family transcriptional regulator [Bordetella hinzii]QWF53812.1 IclR family transcriptional regulator [Bordetella hinzii]